MSVALLVFSLIIFAIEAFVIRAAKRAWAPANIVRLFGLTLIVLVAALLVVAGYGNDQISPVMGLLGVIAGYLLGQTKANSASD